MEDLGLDGISGDDGPIRERYLEAACLLAHLHIQDVSRELPLRENGVYQLPEYDLEPLLAEVELFIDWFMPTLPSAHVSESARAEFLLIWRNLLEPQLIERKSWTLRDFHSANLFWIPLRTGIKRVGIIDIQDAVWGHPAYDVGSLLQDARVFISEDLELELFEKYVSLRNSGDLMFYYSKFTTSYAIYASQRIIKILGIFVRLDRRDGKPEYLRYIPQLRNYLHRKICDRNISS
jgi:aminoglycoside/choline kinase family phosphotransferase